MACLLHGWNQTATSLDGGTYLPSSGSRVQRRQLKRKVHVLSIPLVFKVIREQAREVGQDLTGPHLTLKGPTPSCSSARLNALRHKNEVPDAMI